MQVLFHLVSHYGPSLVLSLARLEFWHWSYGLELPWYLVLAHQSLRLISGSWFTTTYTIEFTFVKEVLDDILLLLCGFLREFIYTQLLLCLNLCRCLIEILNSLDALC